MKETSRDSILDEAIILSGMLNTSAIEESTLVTTLNKNLFNLSPNSVSSYVCSCC